MLIPSSGCDFVLCFQHDPSLWHHKCSRCILFISCHFSRRSPGSFHWRHLRSLLTAAGVIASRPSELTKGGNADPCADTYLWTLLCVTTYIFMSHTWVYIPVPDLIHTLWVTAASPLAYRKSVLNIHWKGWCWSWNSNTLATWCKELTH